LGEKDDTFSIMNPIFFNSFSTTFCFLNDVKRFVTPRVRSGEQSEML